MGLPTGALSLTAGGVALMGLGGVPPLGACPAGPLSSLPCPCGLALNTMNSTKRTEMTDRPKARMVRPCCDVKRSSHDNEAPCSVCVASSCVGARPRSKPVCSLGGPPCDDMTSRVLNSHVCP